MSNSVNMSRFSTSVVVRLAQKERLERYRSVERAAQKTLNWNYPLKLSSSMQVVVSQLRNVLSINVPDKRYWLRR
jgi:hypothetical protein